MKHWNQLKHLAALAATSFATQGIASELHQPQCAALETWAATVDPKDRYTPLPGNNTWAPRAFGEPAFADLFGKPALDLTQSELDELGAYLVVCRKAATRDKRYDAQKSLNAARGLLLGRLKRVISAAAGMAEAAKAQTEAETAYRESKSAARAQQERRQEQAVQEFLARLLGQPDSPELLRDLALLRSEPAPSKDALYTPFARNFPEYLSQSGRSPSDPDIAARIDARIEALRGSLVDNLEARIAAVPSDGNGTDRLNRILAEAYNTMGPGLRASDRTRLENLARERRDAIRADVTRFAVQNIANLPADMDGLQTLRRWRAEIGAMDVTPGQRAEVLRAAEVRQVEIGDALLMETQERLDAFPETLDGLSRFEQALETVRPARTVASEPALEAFSRAADRRLVAIRQGALPEFQALLDALPESRDGLAEAQSRVSDSRAAPSSTPLREAYLAAATARRDAIRAALDERDRGRREAAIASGGDPRLVGLKFEEPTAGMSLDFRDQKRVFMNVLGMRAAGDYEVSVDDLVVHGPHGQLVLTIEGDTLTGMGLTFERQDR